MQKHPNKMKCHATRWPSSITNAHKNTLFLFKCLAAVYDICACFTFMAVDGGRWRLDHGGGAHAEAAAKVEVSSEARWWKGSKVQTEVWLRFRTIRKPCCGRTMWYQLDVSPATYRCWTCLSIQEWVSLQLRDELWQRQKMLQGRAKRPRQSPWQCLQHLTTDPNISQCFPAE